MCWCAWGWPVLFGPHTAGVALQGQSHASLVRWFNVISTFNNLCLSNVWHYRHKLPERPCFHQSHTTKHVFCLDTTGKQSTSTACVVFSLNHTPLLFSLTWHPPCFVFCCRQYEGGDEGLVGAELLLQKQEEEVQRLQAHLASRLSRTNLYSTDDPLAPSHTSMLDLRDPLYTSSVPLRKPRVCTCYDITDSRICLWRCKLLVTRALFCIISNNFIYIQNILYCYRAVDTQNKTAVSRKWVKCVIWTHTDTLQGKFPASSLTRSCLKLVYNAIFENGCACSFN